MLFTTLSSVAVGLVSLTTPAAAYWRMPCPGRLLTERIDPIQEPGAVAAHVHSVSGGNGLNFTMDYADTQASTCSSCPIKEDLSNYWTPKLYYQTENGSFIDVPQSGDGEGVYGGMTVYYLQRGGPNDDNLTAFPEGFRMLAGDKNKRAYTDDFAGQAVSFVCLDYYGTSSYWDALPNTTCPDGIRAQIFFPQCWDGVNLDSDDHMSHMAYPSSGSYNGGTCPDSHPVHMISLFFEIIYSAIDFEWYNPNQQPFVFSNGDPTGYGFHGDFVNGWNVTALQSATDSCFNSSGYITDCDVFSFFTTEESQACIMAPSVNEAVTGTLDALPGCNPVQWGPEEATVMTNCTNPSFGTPVVYYTNVTGWDYVGCGSDSVSNRTFAGASTVSSSMTVDKCLAYCKSEGYSYAGLEYQTQCFCDNTMPWDRAPVAGVLGNCFSTCAGNSSEYCGGANRLSIYHSEAANTVVNVQCPASNGTYWQAPNGTYFKIECGMDHGGGDVGMVWVSDINGCLEACANNTACNRFSLSGAACYLKGGVITNATVNSAINAARMMLNYTPVATTSLVSSTTSSTTSRSTTTITTTSSPSSSKMTTTTTSTTSSTTSTASPITSTTTSSKTTTSTTTSSTTTSSISTTSYPAASTNAVTCPASNGTVYQAPNGASFLVQCGVDHSGGDLTMVYVSNFTQCLTSCANNSSCVSVSLSANACYMKKQLGKAQSNSGVQGAMLISAASSSTSTSALMSSTSTSALMSSTSASALTSSTTTSVSTSSTTTSASTSSTSASALTSLTTTSVSTSSTTTSASTSSSFTTSTFQTSTSPATSSTSASSSSSLVSTSTTSKAPTSTYTSSTLVLTSSSSNTSTSIYSSTSPTTSRATSSSTGSSTSTSITVSTTTTLSSASTISSSTRFASSTTTSSSISTTLSSSATMTALSSSSTTSPSTTPMITTSASSNSTSSYSSTFSSSSSSSVAQTAVVVGAPVTASQS